MVNIGQTAAAGVFGASDRIEAFGSITGRAGLAFDNFLIYGKGGFAAASNKISLTAFGLTASDTRTHTGYTVGGGVEYGLTPNWSAEPNTCSHTSTAKTISPQRCRLALPAVPSMSTP
jgi:outer membrane immunogenic protein